MSTGRTGRSRANTENVSGRTPGASSCPASCPGHAAADGPSPSGGPDISRRRAPLHPERATADLKKTGRGAGSTPYMTLLAAYATLLHRYNGQEDLLIGSPFANREYAGLEELVGYLANPLVLRADLHGDPTF